MGQRVEYQTARLEALAAEACAFQSTCFLLTFEVSPVAHTVAELLCRHFSDTSPLYLLFIIVVRNCLSVRYAGVSILASNYFMYNSVNKVYSFLMYSNKFTSPFVKLECENSTPCLHRRSPHMCTCTFAHKSSLLFYRLRTNSCRWEKMSCFFGVNPC